MKIRTGFVSNSSSSSFIISKDKVTDWKELISELKELEKLVDIERGYHASHWGDSDETYDVQNDYIFVETAHESRARDILNRHVKDLEENSYHIDV